MASMAFSALMFLPNGKEIELTDRQFEAASDDKSGNLRSCLCEDDCQPGRDMPDSQGSVRKEAEMIGLCM